MDMLDLFGNPIQPAEKKARKRFEWTDLGTKPGVPIVWSYGGGTQSVAMWLLVYEGKLPRPEIIIMADTAYEASYTWEYHEKHIKPMIDEMEIPFVIAPHSLATVDLWGGKDGHTLLIPAFTTLDQKPGECGKLPTFCSNEWKKRVFERQARKLGYGPANNCQVWLGMSVDEIDRLRQSQVSWYEYTYPLIGDIFLHRQQCKDIISRHGLPSEIRSSCWKCPNRTKPEWQDLQENHPADYTRACNAEKDVQRRDPHVWFSEYGARHRLRLDQITWSKVSGEGLIFKNEGCVSGMCNI